MTRWRPEVVATRRVSRVALLGIAFLQIKTAARRLRSVAALQQWMEAVRGSGIQDPGKSSWFDIEVEHWQWLKRPVSRKYMLVLSLVHENCKRFRCIKIKPGHWP